MDVNKVINDVEMCPIFSYKDLLDLHTLITNFTHYAGEYMHILIVIIATILIKLRNYNISIIFYLIGVVLTIFLNQGLKKVFKQRRPSINPYLFDLLITKGEECAIQNNKNYHIFGMPSGHSQICGFTLLYLHLLLKDNDITMGLVFCSILTTYQRIWNKHNTIIQTLFGFILGGLCGISVFYYSRSYLSGELKEKPDDYCACN